MFNNGGYLLIVVYWNLMLHNCRQSGKFSFFIWPLNAVFFMRSRIALYIGLKDNGNCTNISFLWGLKLNLELLGERWEKI